LTKTIKLNETSLVCDKPHNIKCWKKGKEIKHPHPLKWYPDGGAILLSTQKVTGENWQEIGTDRLLAINRGEVLVHSDQI